MTFAYGTAYDPNNYAGVLAAESYTYNNAAWADQLTAYDNTAITYDQIGNPTSYLGWTMDWQGRQLTSAVKGSTSLSYTYDADGIRTSKTLYDTTTYFFYEGGLLRTQKTGNSVIWFQYGAAGSPLSITIGSATYYYVKNLQGDVIGLTDSNGNLVVEYTYDAWGNLLSMTGSLATTIGVKNPFRYRGYYYDTEIGFYYLQSRYYDPVIRRFINADGLVSHSNLNAMNLYAYCGNNPIGCADPHGESWIAAVILVVAVAFLTGCSDSKPAATKPSKAPSSSSTTPQTTTPTKDYDDFLNDLGMRESSNDYTKKNRSGYLGRYQMGSLALKDAGFQDSSGNWTALANSYGVYSEEDFLNSPRAQDAAITAYHKKVSKYIRYYGSDKYIGTIYCGVKVTPSGLLAASHLVGAKGLSKALANGTVITDGNGVPASEYMALFGGYNVDEVW